MQAVCPVHMMLMMILPMTVRNTLAKAKGAAKPRAMAASSTEAVVPMPKPFYINLPHEIPYGQ